VRFNPPPNWPPPEPGWYPPPGWQPPVEWGPAPLGWPLWVQDAAAPTYVTSTPSSRAAGGCLRFVVGFVVVLIVLAIVGALVAGLSHKTTTSRTSTPVEPAQLASQAVPSFSLPAPPADENTAHPPIEDVALAGCSVDPSTGWPSCQVTIVNRSSKTSNYLVTVSLLSADDKTKYGDMIATVDDLAPGQTSPQTAQGFVVMPAGGHAVITDVQRYASGG